MTVRLLHPVENRALASVESVEEFARGGFGIALLLSLLWAFGREDGVRPGELIKIVVVLGLPASIGAAARRLLV